MAVSQATRKRMERRATAMKAANRPVLVTLDTTILNVEEVGDGRAA